MAKRDKNLYWVLIGKQRKCVLKNFPEKQITSEELRKLINNKTSFKLSLREISRHLTSFSKRGLVKCLNPNAPYNKFYFITANGKKVKKEIEKMKWI